MLTAVIYENQNRNTNQRMAERMRTLPFYHHNKEYESRIHEFRVARGFRITDLMNLTKGSQSEISALANGTISPLFDKKGDIKPLVLRLMEVLGASFEDLFPRYSCALAKDELLPDQIKDLFFPGDPQQPEDVLCEKEWAGEYGRHFRLLNPRLQKVLNLRFFEGCTLQECGDSLGISRERARQLESKALRLFKHKIENKKERGQ